MKKDILKKLYFDKGYSVSKMAKRLGCSQSKINYWLGKYDLQKRSISEAIYLSRNPHGDPFKIIPLKIDKKSFLFGLGLGLYWGEGTKSNKNSIRLGNTDPVLVKRFIEFLAIIYGVKRDKLKFGLQIFNDSLMEESLRFWIKELNATGGQFQKPILSEIRGKGTYRKKSKHGVLTVYFNNKKLRDVLCHEIEKLRII